MESSRFERPSDGDGGPSEVGRGWDDGGSTRPDIDSRSAQRDESSSMGVRRGSGGEVARAQNSFTMDWRGIELSGVSWTLPHVATRKRNVATSLI
jgi:hypothetical protein